MTLETCCQCDALTGRAGQFEDSLYDGDFGPYCQECWDELDDIRADHEHDRRRDDRRNP